MTDFDPAWERDIYGQGRHCNRWPFDTVMSFVFRHAPRDRPRAEIRVLDIGCGTGNNLWLPAQGGFAATCIEASPSAVILAHQRLAAEGVAGGLLKSISLYILSLIAVQSVASVIWQHNRHR